MLELQNDFLLMGLVAVTGLFLFVGLRFVFGHVSDTPKFIANLSEKKKTSDYPTGGEGF